MGIISKIKEAAAKAGNNKDKILYVKEGEKVRVRFLQEIDDGFDFVFHDSFADGINTLCREQFGKDCPLCENESLRTRSLFAWSVWNYDTKKVEIALYAVNNCTPVQSLINMSETYNTIMDRDYVLQKTGKQQNTTYTVIPMDKNKFKNEKAKPYSRSAALKVLDHAFPFNDLNKDEDDDEDEDEAPKKKSKGGKIDPKDLDDEMMEEVAAKSKKSKKKVEDDDDEKLPIDWMEEQLDDADIDSDEFCEYHEVKSLKKLSGKSKKQFKALIKEYLESLEDEDEDEDDDYDDED